MPRGQTAHLEKYVRRLWNHPTVAIKLPKNTIAQAKAIAQWADKQPDPIAAMQRVLDWIEQQAQDNNHNNHERDSISRP